jgi:hypothetical protein
VLRSILGVAAVIVLGCGPDGEHSSEADAAAADGAAATDTSGPDTMTPDAARQDAGPGPCDGVGFATFDENAGFTMPSGITQAYETIDGVWTLRGPAEWSCLCTPSDDVPTSVAVDLSGTTRDFQTGNAIDTIEVDAFGFGGMLIDSTTSSASGMFLLSIPVGTERISFRLVDVDPVSPEMADTYHVAQRLLPDAPAQSVDLLGVSNLTLNSMPAMVGVARTPGLGLSSGVITDCNGYRVAGAVATVSATSGTTTHLAGADTYYFSAGSPSLPVRHTVARVTNEDGLFLVIELPPTTGAYLQVWGYVASDTPGVDPIRLLSEVRADVVGDSWVDANMEALRD